MPIKHLKTVWSDGSRKRSKKGTWKNLLTTVALAGGALLLVGFFILTLTLAWLSRDLPDPNNLLTRDVPQSTKIYDRTGEVLLYEIHGDEKRTLVKIEDIPDVMQKATIAIEDKDFYNHHGIYWKGLLRAFTIGLIKDGRIQGTSTLTQQFVRNALLTTNRSSVRKLREILLSLQMERKFSKEQILQLYLNEIPYGSNLYGIESAARGYFGKPAKELTLDEAALLASLPQGPDIYNPYGSGSRGDNRKRLVERQHSVINAMADQGYITRDQAEEAKKIETLSKLVPKHVGDIKAPHFVMWVREQLVEKYGQKTVETGGLNVITTLDWRLQQAAEKAVSEGVAKNSEKYKMSNAALAAIGPGDGQVLAMVGSKDFFNDEDDGQVNVTLRPRQPGSSFKPIVYAAGFMKGFLPETMLWDVNTVFKTDAKNYTPKNYDLSEHGPISVRNALQTSLNTPAVKMLYLVGVGRVLDLAEQLGYTTFADRSRFGLSLVLGGGEVKLLEHVAAFGAFATEGVLMPTTGILKVDDPTGTTLEEWKISEGKRVYEPQITRLVSNVLTDDAARAPVFGSGSALTLPGRPVAAKTGTTNDYIDAWTVGYTPSLVAGVWAGNNDNTPMTRAGGSLAAAPIWNAFMREAVKGAPVQSFTAPAPPDTDKPAILGTAFVKKVKVDKITGKLASDLTPPDLIEERTFHEAHDILFYIDKNDPRGPAPEDPASDPQFTNWENAVAGWVEKNQWNATSTAPTEVDDVHTPQNIPTVNISYPFAGTDLNSRSFTIRSSVSAPRRIVTVTARMEGYVIGSSFSADSDIQAIIPSALAKGYHELIVEARDDVGNVGKTTVQINLLAEPEALKVSISDPIPGSSLKASDFPREISVIVNDLSNISKIDLYSERSNGAQQLIGSDVGPTTNPIIFKWAAASPGDYTIYAVTKDQNERLVIGDRVSIRVEE